MPPLGRRLWPRTAWRARPWTSICWSWALDDSIWEPLRAAGRIVEVRRGDPSDPLLGVVRVSTVGQAPVDLVVGAAAWQREILTRARRVQIADTAVPVAGAADLTPQFRAETRIPARRSRSDTP